MRVLFCFSGFDGVVLGASTQDVTDFDSIEQAMRDAMEELGIVEIEIESMRFHVYDLPWNDLLLPNLDNPIGFQPTQT